ncbi:MAG TPA: asparagine--tRNA ligase [Candidatus Binatia bacterium]|jgi:asparaginyl-tRNA synthetase|nr:asparagine--tRNA ligase [Candidatus Binatia bacterium]
MAVVTVEEVGRHEGAVVTLRGWLAARRSSGKLHFLQLRDGTGTIQCVMGKRDVTPEVFAAADHLPQETSLTITGTIRADARAPIGFELGVQDMTIVHVPATEFPISPKEHGTSFLLEHRHLWLRSSRQHAIMRIRAEVIRACREFLDGRGFLGFDAPILTPAACEGTTTLFPVEYFGETAYLTQSGQLYGEAGAMAFGKIYVFGPTFRAEKSKTRRHLTEFWMIEPEMAFATLDDDMDLAEDFLVHVVGRVLERRAAELRVLERDVDALARIVKPFPRITYTEAIERLRAKGVDIAWGDDLGAEAETTLSQEFDRPVMVHRYPLAAKAFYMKADPAETRVALCVDVLAPEGYGEIIGGGQREDDLAVLEAKIVEHQLPTEAFDWYLDLRRFGSVPHAGFGMGIERCVAWVCGLHHVRETIPFPRMLERLRP